MLHSEILPNEAEQIYFVKCPRIINSLAHDLARAAIPNGRWEVFFGRSLPLGEEDEAFWREIDFPLWFSVLMSIDAGVPNFLFLMKCFYFKKK